MIHVNKMHASFGYFKTFNRSFQRKDYTVKLVCLLILCIFHLEAIKIENPKSNQFFILEIEAFVVTEQACTMFCSGVLMEIGIIIKICDIISHDFTKHLLLF